VSTRRLVMWDIDRTLLSAGRVARVAMETTFQAVTGRAPDGIPEFGGRTDSAIVTEVFAMHGLPAPDLPAFFGHFARELADTAHLIPQQGRAYPGAREVLGALAGWPALVQTTVTGNIAPNARTKLVALDLAAPLDLTVGGYGDEHTVRARLVAASRARAESRYGDFAEVIVVGDTRYDVEAALACGVTAIGVASGSDSADVLRAAGAHVVLDSLADVPAVVDLLTGDART
jgi:phosphoglycolate phosphatase